MMERRVKERLIGATLLVALIVLIVPEMLSGPRQPSARPLTAGLPTPIRSVSVDLATSKATADPGFSEAAASAPAAGASASLQGAPEEAAPESPPTVTTLRAQAPSPPALETPVPSPKSAVAVPRPEAQGDGGAAPQGRRGWSVQLGSFASRANADRLIRQLQSRTSGPLYVSASGAGPSLRYRVRVGPLADRGAAEHAAGKLRAAGHSATVVAPAA
jgi:DedD protein